MEYFEIIITAIAALLTAFTANKWGQLKPIGRVVMVFVIVSLLVGAVNSWRKESKEEKIERINAKFGDIKDLAGATVPMLQIGNRDTGTILASTNNLIGFVSNKQMFQLYVKNNRLNVDAIIRGFDGKPIAVIEDNTWTLYNEDFEYNDDNTAFELVTEGERKVFFQIVLVNGIAKVSGFLLDEEGTGLMLASPVGNSGSLLRKVVEGESIETIEPHLFSERVFKYPRAKYYGVRVSE